MALETVRPAPVEISSNEPKTPVGFGESLVAGFKSGLNENIVFSILPDAVQGQDAANNPYDQINIDLYNPGHPFYIEDLPHDQGISYKHLKEMFDSRAEAAKYAQIFQDGGLLDNAGYIAGTFGAALFDPITYVPVPFLKGVTSFTKQALAVGTFNAALEVPLYPLLNEAYQQRGLGPYEYEQVVNNMGLAFVAGGGLTTLMRGGGFAYSKLKAARLRRLDPIEREVQTQRQQNPGYDYDSLTRDLIGQDVLQRNQLDFDSVRKHKFTVNSVEDFWVDTAGRRKFSTNDVSDGDVKITSQADKTKLVEGSTDNILKIISTLADRADDGVRFIVRTTDDGKVITLDKTNIRKWIDQNLPDAEARLNAKLNANRNWFDLSRFINPKVKFRATLDSWDQVLFDRSHTFEIVPDSQKGIDIEKGIGKFYALRNVEYDPAKETLSQFKQRQQARKDAFAAAKDEAKSQNKQKFMFENKEYNINDTFKAGESQSKFPERQLITDPAEKKRIIARALELEEIRRKNMANDINKTKQPLYDPEDPFSHQSDIEERNWEIQQQKLQDEKVGIDRHTGHAIRRDLEVLYGDPVFGYEAKTKDLLEIYTIDDMRELGFELKNGALVDTGQPLRRLEGEEAELRALLLEQYRAVESRLEIKRGQEATALCLRNTNSNF